MSLPAGNSLRSIVLLACLLLGSCSEPPLHSPLAPGAVVLAFGDSVTYGTGASAGQDYPTHLASLTGWSVVNAGVPGELSREGRQRIGALLSEHNPELVLVELGGNDFLRKRSEALVKEDLRNILQQCAAAGVPAVLVAVPRLSLLRAGIGALSDSRIYQELAEEERVGLIPDVFSAIVSDSDLRADRVHPNAAGYRQLAEQISVSLSAAGWF